MIIAAFIPPLIACLFVLLTRFKWQASGVALLISTAILALHYPANAITESYLWIPAANLNLTLFLDWLSFPIALAIGFVSALTAFYSARYTKRRANLSLYYFCLLLFSLGMLGVVLSTNMLAFFLFWDIMVLASYFLITEFGGRGARSIGLKYFIYMGIASASLLLGIAALYAATGTLDFLQMHSAAWSALIPLTLACTIKLGVFPFHDWLPAAHATAPAPISAMLSGLMVNVGGYALIRFASLFKSSFVSGQLWLLAIAVISMVFGALMVFRQTLIKKVIAWSTVSQGGYVLFGAATLTSLGLAGAGLHLVTQALTKAILFFAAGAIIWATGKKSISGLGGLFTRMPGLIILVLVGLFSLSGIPAFATFQSELLIFAGGLGFPIFVAIALLGTALTLGYSLWFLHKISFSELKVRMRAIPKSMLLIMAVLAGLIILLGVYPNPLLLGV